MNAFYFSLYAYVHVYTYADTYIYTYVHIHNLPRNQKTCRNEAAPHNHYLLKETASP